MLCPKVIFKIADFREISMTLSSVELLERQAQDALRLARDNLLLAQQSDNPEVVLQGNEGSMLQGSDAQKSVEIFEKVKQKYQTLLEEQGGIDAVLKELEDYIIDEKLKDRRFATDAALKKCKREDFQTDGRGNIKQQNDNLNERGRYKAALRAITDETRIGPGVNFGSVFHHGSRRGLGPAFGGGATPAREVLAFMWLAANHPELSEEAIKEFGSEEKAIDAEKESLVNVLAEIQRAHNDGSYSAYDSTQDNPSCDAGAWGRTFISAPLNNQLTKMNKDDVSKTLESPGENLSLDVRSKILECIKGLSSQQKMEFLNNYNACYVAKTAEPNEVIGYSITDLSKSLESNMLNNFESYWRQLVQNNDVLKEIRIRSQGEHMWWGAAPYTKTLEAHKEYYKTLWKIELEKIARGELHQQSYYEPLEKDVLERELKEARKKGYPMLESVAVEEKQRLSEVKAKIADLRQQITALNAALKPGEDLKARQLQIEQLSQEYQGLQQEKNKLLSILENKAKRLAMEELADNIGLLKLVKNKEEVAAVADRLVPKIPDLQDEAKEQLSAFQAEAAVDIAQVPPVAVEASNLPPEIADISIQQVQDDNTYKLLTERMKQEPEKAQRSVIKKMLMAKGVADEDIAGLIDKWIAHQKSLAAAPVSVQAPVVASGLPAEIADITMSAIEENQVYKQQIAMVKQMAIARRQTEEQVKDAIILRTVKNMLTTKGVEEDKVEALAEQWVAHQKSHLAAPAVISAQIANPQPSNIQEGAASVAPVVPIVPTIEPILPSIELRKMYEREFLRSGNLRSPEEILTRILPLFGMNYESQNSHVLSIIQWFKDKDALQKAELASISEKVKYSDREAGFLAEIDKVYNDPRRTTRIVDEMVAIARQAFPFTSDEAEHFRKLGGVRVNYLAGLRRANAGNINDSIDFLMYAAQDDSLEAKYALVMLAKYNPSISETVNIRGNYVFYKYKEEIDKLEASLKFVERTKDIDSNKDQEIVKIDERVQRITQSPEIQTPNFSEAEQFYLEQVEFFYNNFPPGREKSADNVKMFAINRLIEKFGYPSPEYSALENNKEMSNQATGRFLYLAANKRITVANVEDDPRMIEGLSYLTQAAALGEVKAQNKLHDPKIQKIIANKERTAIEDKYRLLKADPLTNNDIDSLIASYCKSVNTAAKLGSFDAKLILIKIALGEFNDTGFEKMDPDVLTKMKTVASAYFPRHFTDYENMDTIIKSLLEFDHSIQDPVVKAQTQKLISDLAQKSYLQYSQSQSLMSKDYVALERAATLHHPLAQLEIISLVSSKESMYINVFNSQIPIDSNSNEIDYKALINQATKITQNIDPTLKDKAEKIISNIRKDYITQIRAHVLDDLKVIEQLKSRGEMRVTLREKAIKDNLALLKENGVDVSFELMLADLPGFKNAVESMPVDLEWLNQMRADLEDNEQNIRLAVGVIQQGLQSQRNEKIFSALNEFLTPEMLAECTKAINQHEVAEVAYYDLLKKEKVPTAVLGLKINALQDEKENINTQLKALQGKFIGNFTELSLTAKDKEYIAKLLFDRETLSSLKENVEVDSPMLRLLDAAERMHRSDLIKDSQEKKKTILEETRIKLEDLVKKYKDEIKKSVAQVNESVESQKSSKASKQLTALMAAENELDKILVKLRSDPEQGLQSYQGLAQKIENVTEKLDTDLKAIGTLKTASKAKNAVKSKMNGLLKAVGMEHQFRINTALTSTQETTLKATTAEIAKMGKVRTDYSGKRDLRRKQGILFVANQPKEQLLSYTSDSVKLATEFMNKNLNMGALKIDFNKDGRSSEDAQALAKEFQAHLQSGVYAEIKQITKEPILVEFKSIDGSKAMTVEVTKYMFDQFIAQQKTANEQRIEAEHRPHPSD
jgi:hypothetical protein